jgi:hypothetical protein
LTSLWAATTSAGMEVIRVTLSAINLAQLNQLLPYSFRKIDLALGYGSRMPEDGYIARDQRVKTQRRERTLQERPVFRDHIRKGSLKAVSPKASSAISILTASGRFNKRSLKVAIIQS